MNITTDDQPVELDDFLSEAITLLETRESKPEGVYWFEDDDDRVGEDYCYDCIHTIKPGAERGDDYMGGGDYESDGCEICANCGKFLAYTLTDYGVENELAHFVESGFDWNSAQECYELARVANGIYENATQAQQLFDVLVNGNGFPAELQDVLTAARAAIGSAS